MQGKSSQGRSGAYGTKFSFLHICNSCFVDIENKKASIEVEFEEDSKDNKKQDK